MTDQPTARPRLRLAPERINPDTKLPLPSPSPDDGELIEECINRYHDRLDYDNQDRVLEEVLTEAVVRARTRAWRAGRAAAETTAAGARREGAQALHDAEEELRAGNWTAAQAHTDSAAHHFAVADALTRHYTL